MQNRALRALLTRLLETKAVRSLPWLYLRLLTIKIGYPDPELQLLPFLCEKSKCSVDIGSHRGDYAFHMLRHSQSCHVFEPRPKAVGKLKSLLKGSSLPIRIHEAALSNSTGNAVLKIATECPGRSTLEDANSLKDFYTRHVSVPVRRLDDYELKNVGCIKIDVEGHEVAVLKGAIQTIRREEPSLIIEAEERHSTNSVQTVHSLLKPLGYDGFFLQDGKLRSIKFFDTHECQTSLLNGTYVRDKSNYINNFIFVKGATLSKAGRFVRR